MADVTEVNRADARGSGPFDTAAPGRGNFESSQFQGIVCKVMHCVLIWWFSVLGTILNISGFEESTSASSLGLPYCR